MNLLHVVLYPQVILTLLQLFVSDKVECACFLVSEMLRDPLKFIRLLDSLLNLISIN